MRSPQEGGSGCRASPSTLRGVFFNEPFDKTWVRASPFLKGNSAAREVVSADVGLFPAGCCLHQRVDGRAPGTSPPPWQVGRAASGLSPVPSCGPVWLPCPRSQVCAGAGWHGTDVSLLFQNGVFMTLQRLLKILALLCSLRTSCSFLTNGLGSRIVLRI